MNDSNGGLPRSRIYLKIEFGKSGLSTLDSFRRTGLARNKLGNKSNQIGVKSNDRIVTLNRTKHTRTCTKNRL